MRATKLYVNAALVTLCAAIHLKFADADADALDYLSGHASQYTQELIDLVKIPSISSLPGNSMTMLNCHLTRHPFFVLQPLRRLIWAFLYRAQGRHIGCCTVA